MADYVIQVSSREGGEVLYTQLVRSFNGEPSESADYIRLLHLAAARTGATIVGHDDDGMPVRIMDLVY